MESRFETVRTRLEQQYQPMLTEPESGPDQETLKQELEKYETLHQNEPLIRLKAEMLALILTRGRIGIDPFDRFVDHIEGKGLLWDLNNKCRKAARSLIGEAVLQSTRAFGDGGIFISQMDQSHTSPDWYAVLALGPAGLRDRSPQSKKPRIRRRRSSSPPPPTSSRRCAN